MSACLVCGAVLLAVDGLTLRELKCGPCRGNHRVPLTFPPVESARERRRRVARLVELDWLLDLVEAENEAEFPAPGQRTFNRVVTGWQPALPLHLAAARRLGVAVPSEGVTGAELHAAILDHQQRYVHDIGDMHVENRQANGRFRAKA